jgi:phage baseplate assembly protein V
MKIGIVTATDPGACRVRVQMQDQDGVLTDWLPVMHQKTLRDKAYWMPDEGEHVVCMMDENEEFGVVLGAIYSDADTPPVSSQDKLHVAFDDGTTIEYDRAAGTMQINCVGDITITSGTHISLSAPRIDLN